MGDMGIYTLLRLNGSDLAGLYKLEGPQFAGVPPHWMPYIAVDNVDADTETARGRGATILAGPMDVPGVGRMSCLKDPQGAAFSLFQAGGHEGSTHGGGTPGTFCWSELMTPDPGAARSFYSAVVGWAAKQSDLGPMPYTEWQVGGRSVGGMMPLVKEMGPIPPHWMSYVAVADCDATVRKATGLGGRVLREPMDIPQVGRFAVLSDPQGASFAIIKLG